MFTKNFLKIGLVVSGICTASAAMAFPTVSPSTLNIFTPIDGASTKAGSYYKKVSNNEYLLYRCTNKASNCNNPIERQSFWYVPNRVGHLSYNSNSRYVRFAERSISGYQCVALVKMLTGSTAPTSSWRPGDSVHSKAGKSWDNASYHHRGKAIATFNNKHYNGHTGILLEYVYDNSGNPIGFWMLDQNVKGKGQVRKHLVKFSGSGVYDGSQYYFIK